MGTLGLQPDTVTFASLMDPARSAPPSQAVSWLQSMQQAGVEPDTLCYNKVIASYARARLPEVAQEWLETMREAGVPPTVVSYSTSINGYAKTAQPAQAVALLRQMAQLGLAADTVALNGVLEAHARAQEPRQAVVWLRRMERGDAPSPDVVRCRAAAQRASLVPCPHAPPSQPPPPHPPPHPPLHPHRTPHRNPTAPPPHPCPLSQVSYTIVISSLAKAGELDEAAALLGRMEERGVVADLMCINTLVAGYATRGRLEQADALLERMARLGVTPDQWTFGAPRAPPHAPRARHLGLPRSRAAAPPCSRGPSACLRRPAARDVPAERAAQGGEAVRPEDAARARAALELLRDLAAPLDRRGAAAQPRGGVRPREPSDD